MHVQKCTALLYKDRSRCTKIPCTGHRHDLYQHAHRQDHQRLLEHQISPVYITIQRPSKRQHAKSTRSSARAQHRPDVTARALCHRQPGKNGKKHTTITVRSRNNIIWKMESPTSSQHNMSPAHVLDDQRKIWRYMYATITPC